MQKNIKIYPIFTIKRRKYSFKLDQFIFFFVFLYFITNEEHSKMKKKFNPHNIHLSSFSRTNLIKLN